MFAGGSFVSVSSTWLARTVTSQRSPSGRSSVGLRTTLLVLVEAPTKAYPRAEPVEGHLMVKLLNEVSTGSLKLMVMFVLRELSIDSSTGDTVVTAGCASVVKVKV